MNKEIMELDLIKIKIFKELGGEVLPDGNMFGAGIGCLSKGCFGFKETRIKAIRECINNLYKEVLRPTGISDLDFEFYKRGIQHD